MVSSTVSLREADIEEVSLGVNELVATDVVDGSGVGNVAISITFVDISVRPVVGIGTVGVAVCGVVV